MTGKPSEKEAVVVSACLLGQACRYDGGTRKDPRLAPLLEGKTVVEICPEVMGGLPVPRPKAVMLGGLGPEVARGTARIVFKETGRDVTSAFLAGARAAVDLARRAGAVRAYLKSRSPSCGAGTVTVEGERLKGFGVAAWLLREEGLRCIEVDGEREIPL